MPDFFVHPQAIVEAMDIGAGTRIWAFAHVMKGAVVGQACNIGEHCFIESGSSIGNNVTLKNGNQVWEGVHLGDDVFVGPQVVFTNDLHPRSPRLQDAAFRYVDRRWLATTKVDRGASVGAGAVILAGNTLHEFCMVAAGSVVTRDVPSHALVMGSPAKIAGWVCRCGMRLNLVNDSAKCTECGSHFVSFNEGVRMVAPEVAA
jgi:UDP-2-acetamido-3-amino-2,3-dideoxy-glucuronate N-acetyltransferase